MLKLLKAMLRRIEPRALTARRARLRAERLLANRAKANRHRSTAEVFTNIYATNAWGGEPGEYFSGTGSVGDAASAYVAFVNRFVADHGVRSVVDIGCGDYRIGRRLDVESYVGIDVVAPVCAANTERFGSAGRSFLCRDAAGEGDLPPGDLCLIRQALQHLSNAQIGAVLAKLGIYRHVLVTEHYPSAQDFRSVNRDIVHGQDTRLFFGSGVYLDAPPFGLKVELVLECMDSSGVGVYRRGPIRTYLVGLP